MFFFFYLLVCYKEARINNFKGRKPKSVLTCPECFPAVQEVKEEGAESTSCEEGSGGQDYVKEAKLVIWPEMCWME